VPRAELACGRVGDDGCDGRAAGQTSIKALVGVSCLHGCQMLYLHDVGNRSSTRVGGGARDVRLGPRASRGRTSCARRRLVVRGGDFSCKAETCRGDSSSGELVGDAANWSKTGCLASVGLDQGLLSSLS
jgi:hypothetical protein